jgi:single-strand DNA-binding protein
MASRSLNKVMLIGNLGKDAETRFTPSGTAVTNFTVATSRRWKDQQSGEWKDETDWHDVVLWKSENVSQYLLKGKQVFVEGRLQTRSWEDQNGNKRYRTEVVADNLILLRGGGAEGGGGGGGSSDEYSQQGSSRQQAAGAGARNAGGAEAEDHGITDDDVPF